MVKRAAAGRSADDSTARRARAAPKLRTGLADKDGVFGDADVGSDLHSIADCYARGSHEDGILSLPELLQTKRVGKRKRLACFRLTGRAERRLKRKVGKKSYGPCVSTRQSTVKSVETVPRSTRIYLAPQSVYRICH